MARIAFAWELGADLGHVAPFMPVARQLRELGHEVVLVVRELHNMEALVGGQGFEIVQAPIWLKAHPELGTAPLNYSDIMRRHGYLSADGLMPLLRAWLSLWSLLRPALIIAEHAPTALLSGRVAGIRRVTFGSGFHSPPRTLPLPGMRPWQPRPREQLEAIDSCVVAVMNACLAAMAKEPLSRGVAELFETDEEFLCTFPELDHYACRVGGHYWGPAVNIEQGEPVAWPAGEGRRVFAYLKPRCRDFTAVLQALAQADVRAVVYAPGAAASMAGMKCGDRILVRDKPVRLAGLLEHCDLVIAHGGAGTVPAALLSGVPLLLLPMQLEQFLASSRVAALGAGLLVRPDEAPPKFGELLGNLLGDPRFARAAQDWAARHSGYRADEQVARIAARIDAILHG